MVLIDWLALCTSPIIESMSSFYHLRRGGRIGLRTPKFIDRMRKMHTTTEAAAVLGVQPKTVTRYILRGPIQAKKHGRDYQIADEELERFRRNRRKPGKPRTKKAPTESPKRFPRSPSAERGTWPLC